MLTSLLPVSKSLQSYNPIPNDCVLCIPAFHNSIRGPVFKSVDPFGHTVTVVGAPPKIDQGFALDGTNDWLSVPDATSLNITTTITVLVWARVTEWAWKHAANNGYLIDKGDLEGTTVGYAIFADDTADRFTAHIVDGGTRRQTIIASGLNAGQWYLAGMTYDGSNVTGYLDGVQSGTPLAHVGDIDASPGVDLGIGNEVTNTSREFFGDIGEVALYRGKAFTADEMLYWYQRTKGRYL